MTMQTGEDTTRVGAPRALETTTDRRAGELDERTFTGSLAELGLPDVLQLLESLRKTGSLHLSGPGGLVFFALERGRIIGCDDGFDARGTLAARATALAGEVLGWRSGTFTFVACGEDETRAEGEPLAPTAVVLEALRLADELAAARGIAGAQDAGDPLARPSANDDTPVDPPTAVPPPPVARRRRGLILALALGATALVAGSVGYQQASRPAAPKPPVVRSEPPHPAPPQPEVSTLGAALQRAREAATDDKGD